MIVLYVAYLSFCSLELEFFVSSHHSVASFLVWFGVGKHFAAVPRDIMMALETTGGNRIHNGVVLLVWSWRLASNALPRWSDEVALWKTRWQCFHFFSVCLLV